MPLNLPSHVPIFRCSGIKPVNGYQNFKGDLGYLGEDLIDTPIKTPRNGELTTDQKKENKEFSFKRVFVEHRIRSVKIFRVVQDRFRLKPKKYEQVILTICGKLRLRIGALIFPTKIDLVASGLS